MKKSPAQQPGSSVRPAKTGSAVEGTSFASLLLLAGWAEARVVRSVPTCDVWARWGAGRAGVRGRIGDLPAL